MKPPPDIAGEIFAKSIARSQSQSPTKTAKSNLFWYQQEHKLPENLLCKAKGKFIFMICSTKSVSTAINNDRGSRETGSSSKWQTSLAQKRFFFVVVDNAIDL